MNKETNKIGQELEITSDFTIETLKGVKINIKKGDKGFLDSRGVLHYTSGEGRGCMQGTKSNLKGYDTENIALMVYNRLNGVCSITQLLENEGITKESIVDEIEYILSDILV